MCACACVCVMCVYVCDVCDVCVCVCMCVMCVCVCVWSHQPLIPIKTLVWKLAPAEHFSVIDWRLRRHRQRQQWHQCQVEDCHHAEKNQRTW